MTQASDLDRVWALAEKIGFCMLSTLSDGEIFSRPMAAHAARDENAFYFLTDAQSDKDEEIGDNPAVGLAFTDSSGQQMKLHGGQRGQADAGRAGHDAAADRRFVQAGNAEPRLQGELQAGHAGGGVRHHVGHFVFVEQLHDETLQLATRRQQHERIRRGRPRT